MLIPPLEDVVPVASQAVDLAAELLLNTQASGELTMKGDRDYATDLDFEIERRVREHLRLETPQIGFLGEEEGTYGPEDTCWALDPIDGTVNFVQGMPLFGVSLALISRGQPLVGVIDLPAFGVRYTAAAGHGAFCGERRLCVPPPPADLAHAVVAIGDYAVGEHSEAKNDVRLAITARLAAKVLRVRMLGSAALDLAWLAEGRLSASLTMSNNLWDMSAGVVLARETGHTVVDGQGDQYSITSEATIAAHPALLPAIVDQVRQPA